jgi:hypothetical protein
MNRTHLSPHYGRSVFSIGFKHLQTDPGADSVIMARGIAAAVKVQADCRGALLKGQTEFGLAYDYQGNSAINAGATPGLDAGKSGGCAHFLPSELLDRNPGRKVTTVYRCRNKKFTSRRKIRDGNWTAIATWRFRVVMAHARESM